MFSRLPTPAYRVVGDRQAKEVGLLHVVWLTLIFPVFKVVQFHLVVQSIPPGKQGAASAPAQIGPLIRRGKLAASSHNRDR